MDFLLLGLLYTYNRDEKNNTNNILLSKNDLKFPEEMDLQNDTHMSSV